MNNAISLLLISLIFCTTACQKKQLKLVEANKTGVSRDIHARPAAATLVPATAQFDYLYQSDEGDLITANYVLDEHPRIYLQSDQRAAIELKQSESWSKGALYNNEDSSWEVQGRVATYTRDKNSTKYIQISPVIKFFESDLQNIIATYYTQGSLHYVQLERKNQPNLHLIELKTYAKTSDYGNDTVLWQDKTDRALFKFKGRELELSYRGD